MKRFTVPIAFAAATPVAGRLRREREVVKADERPARASSSPAKPVH